MSRDRHDREVGQFALKVRGEGSSAGVRASVGIWQTPFFLASCFGVHERSACFLCDAR
ncbi:hypothetical protein [Bacteroidetes bacterium endosymbiont of Geopemphigus sp.]|uniref:hypothetical protein n=1 Tax=Bacteroidetes bacterium endosymbiont of Geopemphigus sp. TaxID=2047937 RepID=UPI0018A870F7|nr:hypothetical protein [Bacteroidetes bacterium endosymbiont of Geopemphigus sp.]